jgi:hypothetical protein
MERSDHVLAVRFDSVSVIQYYVRVCVFVVCTETYSVSNTCFANGTITNHDNLEPPFHYSFETKTVPLFMLSHAHTPWCILQVVSMSPSLALVFLVVLIVLIPSTHSFEKK